MLSTYTVTTLADPGSGGALSLRQAITASNTAGGTNVINFAGGLTGMIDLAAVLPSITSSLTINGPGASLLTVNGHGYGSVLTFAGGGAFSGTPSSTIDGLTITGGNYISGSNPFGDADGGGGIDNSGDALVVSNCVITGNSSTGNGGGIATGKIGNVGSLQVINSTITGNTASSSGGGIHSSYGNSITVSGSVISGNIAGASGGGIDGSSSFSINVSGSTISNNTAVNYAGISSYWSLIVTGSTISQNLATGSSSSVGGGIGLTGGGTGTFTNSNITGNSATKWGGGIYNGGSLTLIDSTISSNTASAGGGLYNSATSTNVVNSTFTGNKATTTTGGGIDNESGTLTITDCTISGNSAATTGGGVYSYVTASDAGTINGTIVAVNVGGDLKPKSGFFSGSNDLIGDGSDQGSLSNTQRGSSSVPLNPLLAPLGNYGGLTQTMALMPGSVAIDNGANFPVLDSQNNNITAFDQRGNVRPQGTAPDIGAFESPNHPVGPATQLVFGQQTSSAVAGRAVMPAIVIYILDANGNLATTDNSMVTLSVSAGPVGAIAGGTAAIQAVNGVAIFTNLLILTTMPGNVTLQATDGTLAPAISTIIAVTLPYTPTTVASVSTTAVSGSRFRVGAAVPIKVGFSKVVNVSGIPQMSLNDGAVAIYSGGSGTSTLTFTYTVAIGENTTRLDYASTTAIALNGGSVIDSAGNPAILTLPAVGSNGLASKNIVIDTTAPTVSTVSTTLAAGTRRMVDGTVPIAIAFAEAVNVTGIPQLTLNDGGTASYTSGKGTTTLTFTYTVAASQNTADLDYASTTALALNGGTIADLAGNSATLTLPPVGTNDLATKNIVIDTTTPTISEVSTSAAANSRYAAGGMIPITVTFAEAVNVTGTPRLTLNDGAVVNYSSGNGTATLTFNYTVAAGQNTADLDYASTTALALNYGTIKDLAGNAATLTLPATGTDGLATKNIVVDTTPATATVTTPTGTHHGNITITYQLLDVLSETCGIVVQYSPNGGTTWNSATPVTGQGDGTTNLASSPTGTSHTYVWASGNDIVNANNSNVKVRITPAGATTGGTTGVFTVNNLTTRTWSGGGADNKWSTAANWVGNVAPLPGDHLVFQSGAAKLESVNDFVSGTQFGSITISGTGYIFHNGILSTSTVQVASGTLTVDSIVADTLIIGSPSTAASSNSLPDVSETVIVANTQETPAAQKIASQTGVDSSTTYSQPSSLAKNTVATISSTDSASFIISSVPTPDSLAFYPLETIDTSTVEVTCVEATPFIMSSEQKQVSNSPTKRIDATINQIQHQATVALWPVVRASSLWGFENPRSGLVSEKPSNSEPNVSPKRIEKPQFAGFNENSKVHYAAMQSIFQHIQEGDLSISMDFDMLYRHVSSKDEKLPAKAVDELLGAGRL